MSATPSEHPPALLVSPLGEEFEVAGRAGPVKLMSAPPILAEARAELLVIKHGSVFMCARPDGDIHPTAVSGEGFYAEDMRYLSELRVSFGQASPILLSRSLESGDRAVVVATNPELEDVNGVRVPQDAISLRRTLQLDDRLYCQLSFRSFCRESVTLPLRLELGADFADVFDIRGVKRRRLRGEAMIPKCKGSEVLFAYEGQANVFRETQVQLDPEPASCDARRGIAAVGWQIELEPGAQRQVLITVAPVSGRRHPRRRSFKRSTHARDQDRRKWLEGCTEIKADNELAQNVLRASTRDLYALLMPAGGSTLPAAGIPWYVAPFGRDSLVTCYESLMLRPELARDTLIALAAMQARKDEAWRDAEPGKILHELRVGELARAGLVPHTPYYGTVDATPLFVMLAAAYYRWTGDIDTLEQLLGPLDRALDWIDRYGDADGDGFVEYQRRSRAGMTNQGWKDSADSIMHADGTLAEGPIALVEVQGYVYLAKLRIADVYVALGQPERAAALRKQARALREAFNVAFWNQEDGMFALALDGKKRQVRSVTSNPGHCLYCDIVEADKAQALCERLMAKDMFSGWGIRTLSSDSPAFNPMSYHNGSVWPHDNAIIAAGLKRYGHIDSTLRIADAMFEAAAASRDYRLAELSCGFSRADTPELVGYPVACMPQAWAAAAPFMLVQAMLGLTARAPLRTLTINKPRLPDWLGSLEINHLKVGDAEVSLGFTQSDGITGFSLRGQRGGLSVNLAATPR